MPSACMPSTPIGPLTIWQEGEALTRLEWTKKGGGPETDLLREATNQLHAYFNEQLTVFDLPLHVEKSGFQRDACDAMSAIPYGETRTYGDLAKVLGVPAQVVGQACGANPLAILIPCHRVLGAQGLGGYSGAGGIETKVALLKLEGAAGLLI